MRISKNATSIIQVSDVCVPTVSTKGNAMNEILELGHDEIELINGAGKIDPLSVQAAIYPEVDNEPPLPPA